MLLLLLLAGASRMALAQTTATILGSVKDQSGAVLPGAEVIATNKETGSARAVVTGGRGEYRIPALAVGTYDVQATMSGFQSSVRSGITLTIGREAAVEFSLSVGNVAEQVTVTGEAPLIETTNAVVGSVVDQQQIRDIPLNARSFLELIPLQTNAVFTEQGEQSASKGFGKKLSISGTRYNSSLFLLDGATMNDSTNTAGSAAGTLAGVETVREFKVITNAFDAEYGRHTGGVVNAVTKSGTNQIHGSAFEFLRNDNLDAAKWEDNALGGGEKPEFRRSQFGGSVGGPIVKERTFFFGSYEGLRQALGETNTYNVPGITMRNGQLPTTTGGVTTIPAPIAVDGGVRPFLLGYPLPNVPCTSACLGQGYIYDRTNGAAQYAKGINQITDQNYYTARVDHRFSNADSAFFRYTRDKATRTTPALTTKEDLASPAQFSTLEQTHIYSPALLGRTHFSFNRTTLIIFDNALPDFQYPVFSFDGTDVPGRITIPNITSWGGDSTNPKVAVLNDFQFKEDLFYSTGRHSMKFGFHFERNQFNQRSDFHSGGSYAYATQADFLRNIVNSANFVRPGSDNLRGWRQNLNGLYFQDDITLRQGLTVNLGVRYEFISTPKEVNGKVATVRDLRDEHFYTFNADQTDLGEPFFENPSLKNFAPRVGIAWDPSGEGRTSIRSGFGMFYEPLMNYTAVGTAGVRTPPYYAVAELFREDFVNFGGINFPNAYTVQRNLLSTIGGRPQVDGFVYHVSQPYLMKWGFDVEHQFWGGVTVETGYAGNAGIHLIRGNMQLNVTPRSFVNGRSFILITQPLPNPNFNRMRWRLTDGDSDYHSFRLSVNKRFSHGFQFQSSYTVSKSTDDSSTWTGGSDFSVADRNGYRHNPDHGLSGFDVRQSWVSNFVVDLPGRNLTGAAGKALGGWSLSSIIRLNSGHPFTLSSQTPTLGANSFRFVDGAQVEQASGSNQRQVNAQNPDQYYEISNYQLPACWSTPGSCPQASGLQGSFQGNIGKNHIISPGVANVDITFMKETSLRMLGEAGGVQFRWELFNLLNRPNFGLPATQIFQRTGVVTAGAGQITTTRTSAREMQFALRMVF
jgi:hypothetical protein